MRVVRKMAEYHFTTPLTEDQVRKLKVGDVIYITGKVALARDEAHERALKLAESGEPLPIDFAEHVLYHAGPIVQKTEDGKWKIIAAGPTTSSRMELFEDEFIERFKVRVIIGKGGMGDRTLAALQKHGAVYASFTGGCGALAATSIKEVLEVHWIDLGTPEALWVLKVENFGPLVVGMDSHGNSLYKKVNEDAKNNLEAILATI